MRFCGERALAMMRETVAGINALHSNEPMIMHRDLKSLNLLVTDDWHIKVADFGLSRFDTGRSARDSQADAWYFCLLRSRVLPRRKIRAQV